MLFGHFCIVESHPVCFYPLYIKMPNVIFFFPPPQPAVDDGQMTVFFLMVGFVLGWVWS